MARAWACLASALLAAACGSDSAGSPGPTQELDAGDAGDADAIADAGGDQDATKAMEVVDTCDGTRELVPIPEQADLLFTAGLYASDGIDSPAEVYALDLDANRAYRITCANFGGPKCTYAGPSASPDHQRMVVMRGCADTNGNSLVDNVDDRGLWIADFAADEVKEVQGYGAINSAKWSSQGQIVFAANEPGNLQTDIYRLDPNTLQVQNLTSTVSDAENDPTWSNAGDRIAFVRAHAVQPNGPGSIAFTGEVWLMDSNGNGAQKIVSFAGDPACTEVAGYYCRGLPADPEFLPGDGAIAFERLLSVSENSGSGRWNIFSASTAGLDQNVVDLTNHPTAFESMPSASARGILMHVIDVAGPFYGIVSMGLDGSARKPLIDASAYEYFLGAARWLP